MSNICGNNDVLHVEAQKQFQTRKTQLPSGHYCYDDEDDESDADYENVEHTLEMKKRTQTPEWTNQDNSEKGAISTEFKSSTIPAAAVAGTKAIILLYVLLLMVTLGWIVFIALAFIKLSALTEEIQHLRMSQVTLKENSSAEIRSLGMKQTELMSNESQMSSRLNSFVFQLQVQESQMLSRLNTLSAQLQAQGCTKVCPCDWILFSGSCYYFSKETRDWSGARQYCVNQASSLAIINNVDELKYLSSKISSVHWLGLTDSEIENTWKWVDGTTVNMNKTYWNSGEPNNVGEEDCGELTEAKLNDGHCGKIKRWICEKSL